MPASDKIQVTLTKSTIGYSQKQRATVKGLGLRKLHHSRILKNTPMVQGMIHKVRHLVTYKEV